jgi:hypothetical protein
VNISYKNDHKMCFMYTEKRGIFYATRYSNQKKYRLNWYYVSKDWLLEISIQNLWCKYVSDRNNANDLSTSDALHALA